MNHKKIISSLLALSCSIGIQAATRTATLKIDNSTRYQTVSGFGGFAFSATWGTNLTDAELTTLFGKGTNQLGYNVMRARISPSEYASWGSDIWGPTIDVIKKCKNLGCQVFASAWTPPAEFTSNNNPVHGYMMEEHFQDYVDFLNKFIARVESSGTDVDYISLQNEPDYEPDGYESCWWSAQTFINFYSKFGPKVNRPLIGPESLAMRRALNDSILNNEAACANLAVLGGHLYGGGNFLNPIAQAKNKPVWMTEYLIDKKEGNYNWDDALLFARVVNTSMQAGMSAWCHYALKSSYGMMGEGTRGTTNGVVTKRGYALSHFAKYVSNTTRIKQTLTDPSYALTTSAYESVTGDSIIVMVINIGSSSYDLTLDLPFCVKSGTKILTRQSSNMTKSTLSIEESCTPTLTVAASCIETFILKKSSERTEPQEADEEPLFTDNFTQYCGENVVPMGWNVTYQGKSYIGSKAVYSYWGNTPKLYYYSPESQIPAGILLSATSSTKIGVANYGAQNGYKLPLEAGQYRLIYHGVGFHNAQKLYTYIRKSGSSSNLTSHSGVTLSNHISGAWGSQSDIFTATPDTIDFTVTDVGNYEINFKVSYYSENAINGYCEALVGGIKLEKMELADGIENIQTEHSNIVKKEYYNLSGQCTDASKPGLYICKETDALGNVKTKKVFLNRD